MSCSDTYPLFLVETFQRSKFDTHLWDSYATQLNFRLPLLPRDIRRETVPQPRLAHCVHQAWVRAHQSTTLTANTVIGEWGLCGRVAVVVRLYVPWIHLSPVRENWSCRFRRWIGRRWEHCYQKISLVCLCLDHATYLVVNYRYHC